MLEFPCTICIGNLYCCWGVKSGSGRCRKSAPRPQDEDLEFSLAILITSSKFQLASKAKGYYFDVRWPINLHDSLLRRGKWKI